MSTSYTLVQLTAPEPFDYETEHILRLMESMNNAVDAGFTVVEAGYAAYEEGTYTVEFEDDQGTPNKSSTTTTAHYVKIGNQVVVTVNNWNGIDTTGLTAGDTAHMTLPFTVTSTSDRRGAGSILFSDLTYPTGADQFMIQPIAGAARARFRYSGNGAAVGQLIVSDFTSTTTDIRSVMLTYYT